MRNKRKNLLLLGGSIIGVVAAGILLYLETGSQIVNAFMVVGVPAMIILFGVLYVHNVKSKSGGTEISFKTSKIRSTANEFERALEEYNEKTRKYPGWNPTIASTIESIQSDFENNGVSFDTDTISYEITDPNSIEIGNISGIKKDIDELNVDIENEFSDFVESEITQIQTSIEKLENANLINQASELESVSTSGGEAGDLNSVRDGASEKAHNAIETIREMARGQTHVDQDAVKNELESAETHLNNEDYPNCVEDILDAQEAIRVNLSDSFDSQRQQAQDLLSVYNQHNLEQYLDENTFDDVERVASQLEQVDDALELTELNRIISDLRTVLADVASKLQADIEEYSSTITNAAVPTDYYQKPSIVDVNIEDELDDVEDLDSFESTFSTFIDELVPALEETKTKATVVDSYPDIKDEIESHLDSSGMVKADDIPVNHADQFFKLFDHRNNWVEHDEDNSVIRPTEIKTYDIRVEVNSDPPMSTDSEVTVDIKGKGHSDSRSLMLGDSAVVTFNDVPEGNHQLSVNAKNAAYESLTEEIVVWGEDQFDITLEKVSITQQYCGELDIDVDAALDDTRSMLKNKFDEEGYISSQMDFAIKQEIVPCLVAKWCEGNNLDTHIHQDEIIGYEGSTVRKELKKVIEYNMGIGDSMTYSELKSKFVSAPLPDSLIQEELSKLDIDTTIRLSDNKMELIE